MRSVNVVKQPLLAAALAASILIFASPLNCLAADLSPGAAQLAEQLGVGARIEQLKTWKTAKVRPDSLELVQTKQAITQAVLVALLQVRAASAQIAYDIFEAGQIRTLLEGRRDRVIKLNTIANFISGGVSEMTGGAFQLVPNVRMDNAGNIIEMVGGGLQTGLSAMALRQQQGSKRAMPAKANMLAPLFNQATTHQYPPIVWRFLSAPPAEGGESPRETLVKQWLEYGRLPGRESARIAALTGNGGKRYPVTIDLLEDRQAMLVDVNALVSGIDRYLLEILSYSDLESVN